MANQERIYALKQYCQHWRDNLQNVAKRRDQLLSWQKEGIFIFENGGENLLPTLIQEVDQAVLQLQKILIKMESLRDRSINGEDV